MTTQEFIDRSKIVHNNFYKYDNETIYKSGKTKVKIICPVHGVYYQRAYHHLQRKHRCKKCSSEQTGLNSKGKKSTAINFHHGTLTIKETLNRFEIAHGTKYDYSKFKWYSDKNIKVEIICPIHGSFMQSAAGHILGRGCNMCARDLSAARQKSNKTEFIKKAMKIFGNAYRYNKVEYINNKTNVIITCPAHGDFSARPDNHLGGTTGCPVCKSSKGERKIFNLFLRMGIEFTREYKIPDNKFRYDFYIPALNLLLEYDGSLHFQVSTLNNGLEGHQLYKKNDLLKNKVAKKNGYNLLRISYIYYSTLEKQCLIELSKYSKYLYNNKLYKDFFTLCEKEKLSKDTQVKELDKYLLINFNLSDIKK